MNHHEHFLARLAVGATVVFEFVLGMSYLATWWDPNGAFARPIPALMLIMLMEFLIIHSSAFMGHVWFRDDTVSNRIRALMGFGLLYVLFALGFSLSFEVWWPLGVFGLLTVNRAISMLIDPNPSTETRQLVERAWATATGLYLVAAFATTLLPVPEFGMTDEVASGLDLSGSGLWISQPHRVVAMGAIYFSVGALLEARTGLRAQRTRGAV